MQKRQGKENVFQYSREEHVQDPKDQDPSLVRPPIPCLRIVKGRPEGAAKKNKPHLLTSAI